MKKRILALLLILALVLPAVSCDILLADPNAPVTPTDSQSPSDTPKDTEKAPVSVTPETQPQTPPDDSNEPQDSKPNDEPETEYVEPETEYVLEEYTVHFILEGYGENPKAQTVTEGKFAKEPKVSIDPAVGTFEGAWYTEPIYDTPYKFDFNTPITGDITLYGYVIPNPADPVLMIDAEAIKGLSGAGAPNVNQVASCEVMTEGGYTFARLTAAAGGDPYLAIIPLSSNHTLPQYMAVSYRTNSTTDGQFFMGSGQGWTGWGDSFNVAWNEGDWNLVVIDLSAQGLTSITDGKLTYARLDFFAGDSADGDYFDVEYVAFFNSAEYAEAYDFAKHPPYVEKEAAGMKNHSFDTFYVNGAMYFETDGGAGDKLTAINNTVAFGEGAAHDSMMLRGWIGFNQPIAQFGYFIDNYTMVYGEFKTATEDGVLAAGGENASRFEITVPLANLKGGTHFVGFVVKLEDGTVVRLRENIKVIIVPEHTEETIDLGKRGQGGPFSGMNQKKFGQRFNIGENFLKAINVKDMAAYANPVNTWAFRIWAWDTDYATTTAAEPIYVLTGENHPENTTFTVADLAAYGITGDFYYEVEHVSGDAGFTGWKAEEYVAEGVQTYVAGELVEGTYTSFIVVGVATPETPDTPDEPVVEYYEDVVIDLSQFADQPTYMPSWGDAGIQVPLFNLGYANYIAIGEMDLSKYSKVEITYSFDGSDLTAGRFEAASSHAIGLKSTATSYGQVTDDNFDGDIAHADMVFEGSWTNFRVAVVDLSEVTYNGAVYVTMHNPEGTTIAISGIKFIGAEKTAEPETPVEPETPAEPEIPTYTAWTDKAIVTHQSFDELYYEPGRVGIFTPGWSANWDKVATLDASIDVINYWGWIGIKGELGQFGYQIDANEAVFDAGFVVTTGDDVINAAKGTGADTASRMLIGINVAGLTGEHTVNVLYKNAAGDIVALCTFKVVK